LYHDVQTWGEQEQLICKSISHFQGIIPYKSS